jgi:hypothetical protein
MIKYFNTFVGNQIGIKCHNFKMPEGERNGSFPDTYSPHFMSSFGLSIDNLYKYECKGEKIELKKSFLSSIFGS